MSKQTLNTLVIVVLVGLLFTQGKGCTLPGPLVVTKATAATYVYEQRETQVPPAVRAGLSKLNERGILATEFDKDTINKQGGTVPEQYKVALAAAKKLPSLIVTGGNTVLRVVENPQTEDDVTGAVPR